MNILVSVYPITFWLRVVLIVTLDVIIIHLIFRLPCRFKLCWFLKAFFSLFAILLLTWMSWNTLKEQWIKNHPKAQPVVPKIEVAQPKQPKPIKPTKEEQSPTTIIVPNGAVSINQKGGITAHTVVNINEPPTEQKWGLDTEQLNFLSQQMAPFAKQEDRGDLITCVLGDPESTKFAEGLVKAFRMAGWQLSGSGFSQAVYSGSVTGIRIRVNSRQSNPPALREFVTVLRKWGIEPMAEINTNVPPNHFRIIVGSKP